MDPATLTKTSCAGAPSVDTRTSLKRKLIYVLAGACLVWVFHDVDPRRLFSAMAIRSWWPVGVAIVADILTYFLQGVRWKLLLAPLGRLSVVRTTQAVYAGLFANELMPLRLGELVRGFLVSRWISSRIAAVVPSILVERFMDATCVAIGVALAAGFVSLPADLIEVGDLLGVVLLAAAVVFVWIVLRKRKALGGGGTRQAEPAGNGSGGSSFVSQLALGLGQIGLSRRLGVAALLSAAMLTCQVCAVWFMMLACGIHLPLAAGAVVLLVVRLGTIIPNAPGNVGSFQFFTVLALGIFAVNKTVAAGFSIVMFTALTAPLWILGLLAISRTGMGWSTIRAEVTAHSSVHR